MKACASQYALFPNILNPCDTWTYSGINGLEVGQSLVIGITILANDLLYMFPHTLGAYIADKNSLVEAAVSTHKFSFYLVVPFVAVSGALYVHNRYDCDFASICN